MCIKYKTEGKTSALSTPPVPTGKDAPLLDFFSRKEVAFHNKQLNLFSSCIYANKLYANKQKYWRTFAHLGESTLAEASPVCFLTESEGVGRPADEGRRANRARC